MTQVAICYIVSVNYFCTLCSIIFKRTVKLASQHIIKINEMRNMNLKQYKNDVNMRNHVNWRSIESACKAEQVNVSLFSDTRKTKKNIKSAVNEMGMSDNENGHEMKRHLARSIPEISVHVEQAVE